MNIDFAPKHIPTSLQEVGGVNSGKWQLTIYPHGGKQETLPAIGSIPEVMKAAEKWVSKYYIGFSL